MIVEYTIKGIKEYYTNNDVLNDINIIENIILNKDENINSDIFHIFPITISLSITLLLASYLLLY
jgi:hypothetical protein